RANPGRLPAADRGGGLQLPGSGLHLTLFGERSVIVPEQVEQAVGEQHGELGEERSSMLLRLPARGLDRDYDVAEQADRARRNGSLEREGEHVRRIVFVPVRAVEHADRRVIDERDGELDVAKVEVVEHLRGAGADGRGRYSNERPAARRDADDGVAAR